MKYSNSDKWKDNWFLSLSAEAKLVFLYFIDVCDDIGIVEIHKPTMIAQTGLTEDGFNDAIRDLSKSYIVNKDKTMLWLKNYLKHQNKLPLSRINEEHKTIITKIEKYTKQGGKFSDCEELKILIPNTKLIKTSKKTDSIVNKIVKPFGVLNDIDKINQNLKSNNDDFKEVVIKDKRTQLIFVKPTIDEVYERMKFCSVPDELAKSESNVFWNYYESKGWCVGKSPMKSWTSTVSTWIRSEWFLEKLHATNYKPSGVVIRINETNKSDRVDNLQNAYNKFNSVANE